jgi:transcriptional regulator with XRE-family HTH domain
MTVKEFIKSSGMTQKQLSERFGIPRRTIEDWSRGASKCPGYVVKMMDEILSKEREEKVMSDRAKIAELVAYLQPEEGEKITDKYYIAGYYNTGEWFAGCFNNRGELVYTIRRFYQNETVCHPWVIVEAKTGVKIWDSLDGFTDAPHPTYMEKAI